MDEEKAINQLLLEDLMDCPQPNEGDKNTIILSSLSRDGKMLFLSRDEIAVLTDLPLSTVYYNLHGLLRAGKVSKVPDPDYNGKGRQRTLWFLR